LVIFLPAGLEDYLARLSRLVEDAQPDRPSPDALNALAEEYGIAAV